MANTWLDQAIVAISKTGFFDYALPFMVVFAVLYGVLEKTAFFGKNRRKLSLILSLIVSLIILPFVSNVDYTRYLSKITLVIVGFVFLAIILGILGYKSGYSKYGAFVAFIVVGFLVATEIFGINSFDKLNNNVFYWIFGLILFFIIISFISGPSKVEPEEVKPGKREERKETRKEAAREEQEERVEGEVPEYEIRKIARIPGSELEKEGIKFGKDKP
jgi:hypothetical protein